MSVLSKAYFHDEKAAFDHLEKLLWINGVVCLHCGVVDKAGRLKGLKGMASSKKGSSAHQLHRTLEITYKSA